MSSSPLAADAVAGVSDPALQGALAEHWELVMKWTPTYATTLGDHRYDDQMARRNATAIATYTAERDAVLARLVGLDASVLDRSDAITHALLRGRLEADVALDACKFHEWGVENGGGSLLGELSYLVESHGVKVARDAENLVARLRIGALLVDDMIENLSVGLADGRVAAAEKVRRAVEQIDAELAKPAGAWAMATPAWANDHPEQLAALRDVVGTAIVPAMTKLRDFLRDRILPRARTDKEGLAGLPDGDVAYRATIVSHVGLAMTPQELHALGHAEIARTDAEIAALGAKVLGTRSLAETIARLRTDKALYFTSGEEILATAQKALDRAKAATPAVFSSLPKTDCVMREIPSYEAPYTTIAYYRQPHYDGSKPGEYFVNTYKPETRPRFELEALTWHESIPGHHTQIAYAQELGAMPAFRKLDGSTAYVEGWALYTEVLAGEMGLYSSDLDRLGQKSYDAWRASRLVVDTGLHAMGWSRRRAEQYMHEHTALTEVNISNEVDRYIGWPGQALAYKVGQLHILQLRANAQEQLGDKFDLKGFHAAVLGVGAVTLPVLDSVVDAWIASVR
ncbi:MAG: DUF885 domain-containing protein [Kofleriaceae bacterium]